MNFTNKLCLCMAMLASLSSFGMMRHIIRDENGFRVFDGKQEREVRSCFVDPLLKRMSPEQLTTFVEQGNRVRAIRLSNGEHRLQAMVPGNGGGPVSASIAYGMTKALLWSGLVGAGIGAAVVTGGAAVGAAGAAAGALSGVGAATGLLATGAATTAGASAAAISAVGVGTAAGVVAGGAAVGAAAGATVATTAAVAGTVAMAAPQVAATVAAAGGIIGGIEMASLGAFAFFLALPIP